ncbi:hypothetical protein [Streptococcus suis]|uniref:hypothetical protein n=1 Tax=Streptococcus suis TaxID=1307 RepID=UPI0005CE842B|nr:hypothetical protein [Streptococcus suis]NQH66285.1 hypothetical protein [Streptococcus suis]CYU94178.1 Uncharacterised protein [Streptococcus suis]
MFNENVSFRFKLNYFLSSFALSYLFLLIIMYIQAAERTGRMVPMFCPILTARKITFFTLFLLFSVSLYSLSYIKKKIEESTQYSIINGQNGGKIGLTYNKGSREFILGVLLPVVTTISVPETPITGLVGVVLLQIILGYFFLHSNELFVNVPLIMAGYSLVLGKYGHKELLLFVKNSQLNSLLGKNVRFIYLGNVEEGNLGIAVEECVDE